MGNIKSLESSPRLPSAGWQTHLNGRGFSAVEVLIVVGIVGILLVTAVKQYQIYTAQARIAEALAAVSGVRLDVEEYYMYHGRWPQSSGDLRDSAMGIDNPDRSKHRVTLEHGGAINIWFQNRPDFKIHDPVLTIRPALAGGDGQAVFSWLCGNAAAPPYAIVQGENRSNIPERFLIKACR